MRYLQSALAAIRSLNRNEVIALLTLLFPVFFVTFVGLMFYEFVVTAIEANLTINLGIIFTALVGVFLIVQRVVEAQHDMRVIRRFGKETADGADMIELLREPWVQGRYVRHYLSRIAHTDGTLSTQLEHSSIESELHALGADYESRLELPQFLVGFMVAMGLLGTFIGLLETLTGISGMLNGLGGTGDVQAQFAKLVVELRKPLAGMGIAFSASMFGLIASLMLAIMMTTLRRNISQAISLARNVMHELTHTARTEFRNSQINMLALQPNALQNSNDGYTGNYTGGGNGNGLAIQSSLDLFVKKVEVLINAFNTQTDAARRSNDLMGVGPRMKETNEKTLETLKAMAFTAEEQQRTTSDVIRAIEAASEAQRQMHNKQQTSIQALIEVNTSMSRAVFSLLESQRASHTDHKTELQAITEVSNEIVRVSGLGVDAQKQLRTDLSTLLRSLGTQMTDLRDVEISGGRHLNDMKENIVKLVDSMALIDSIAGNMTEQSTLGNNLIETLQLLRREIAQQNQLQARSLNASMAAATNAANSTPATQV
jgi:biopolymer transport protein ExbB/TolQ